MYLLDLIPKFFLQLRYCMHESQSVMFYILKLTNIKHNQRVVNFMLFTSSLLLLFYTLMFNTYASTITYFITDSNSNLCKLIKVLLLIRLKYR